jgi:hypothetical protein
MHQSSWNGKAVSLLSRDLVDAASEIEHVRFCLMRPGKAKLICSPIFVFFSLFLAFKLVPVL